MNSEQFYYRKSWEWSSLKLITQLVVYKNTEAGKNMIELYINIFKGPKFGRDNYSANRVRFNWSVSSIGPLWLFQILHGSPRGGSAQESPVPEQQRMPSLAELPPAQINPVWKRKNHSASLGWFSTKAFERTRTWRKLCVIRNFCLLSLFFAFHRLSWY